MWLFIRLCWRILICKISVMSLLSILCTRILLFPNSLYPHKRTISDCCWSTLWINMPKLISTARHLHSPAKISSQPVHGFSLIFSLVLFFTNVIFLCVSVCVVWNFLDVTADCHTGYKCKLSPLSACHLTWLGHFHWKLSQFFSETVFHHWGVILLLALIDQWARAVLLLQK